MLGGKNEQLQMLLEKIMEMFSSMPEKEDMPPAEGNVEVSIEAEPAEKEEMK